MHDQIEPGASPRHTNRLADETSPYLLQHAHNPVDWYPWGPEALARARDEDRPIFLSIGYAACHWCHVMERESFEDEPTAAQLNAAFVPIKVDREERPDLDAIYMDAVQSMTGQGGWPMSVFLTPDGRPFYGGTYFPNRRGMGLPSFRDVLQGVSEAWHARRSEVERSADELATAVARGQRAPLASVAGAAGTGGDDKRAGERVLAAAVAELVASFDPRGGGWGTAPKFPQSMAIEVLLREHVRTADAQALAVARRSLDAMAAGGIYDQLGGGFARYATDAVWLVPHFEKMLYDNALLARAYTHAYRLTGERRYAEVAGETLDFMLRELRVPEGAFAASLDADTDGHEGATYVWDSDEVERLLGDEAALFSAAYGVTRAGNWEGHVILSRVVDDDALAARFGTGAADVRDRLAAARALLLEARRRRVQPARDDKVICSWNGLALAALADASWGLDRPRPDLAAAAGEAAAFLLGTLRDEAGRLRRSWNAGRARDAGTLEDHAHLAEGLLAVYEATHDERWFSAARELMDLVLAHFTDPEGGFYDTADDAEALIARPRGLQDNAIPSGNAMAVTVLLKLSALTGERPYSDAAERAIRPMAEVSGRYPTAFAQWLVALEADVAGIDEIAIVGEPGSADRDALVETARRGFRPWQVVA
ncbi:MAG: uncharacterized protein QOH61_912, partial [Chloroflexota bacterium]|nr:uncharacterized protein [Chloroflexota bacterium]